MKDLIVLVADSYQEKVLEELFLRIPRSLDIEEFTFDIIRSPGHDSGCFIDGHEMLRPLINQYKYAIVVFDFEGSGAEDLSIENIDTKLSKRLADNGWRGRNLVIVIKPELESWIWINSRHVEYAIGWENSTSLYDWARSNNYIKTNQNKPERPKEVFEKALRISETSKSAAIYKKIAANVSFKNCEDPSFKKLISTLIDWFKRL